MTGGSRTGHPRTGSGALARFWIQQNTLAPGAQALAPFLDGLIKATLKHYESGVENHARINAPWTDRTTNARNGLVATSGKAGNGVYSLVLAHQVPYGIWLETRWSGKYRIIMPTLEEFAPKIFDTLEQGFGRFNGSAR